MSDKKSPMTSETLKQKSKQYAYELACEASETMTRCTPQELYALAYLAGAQALAEKYRALEEAAERALQEIHAQKTIWPGEVDDLEDRLAELRKLRGES